MTLPRVASICLLTVLIGYASGRRGLRATARVDGEGTTLLVHMRHGLSRQEVEARLALRGMRVQRQIPRIGVWVVEDARSASPSSSCEVLARDPDVLWAEPNGRVRAAGIVPNDNYYQAQQWNLRKIGLPEAWVFARGEGGLIAVIDTGADLDHPDLAAKIWTNPGEVEGNSEDDDGNGYVDDRYGWDFVNSDGYPDDDHGHGSHVAGIAAADTNNGLGVAGVAWQSRVMAVKVLDEDGAGWWDDVLDGVVYAADNGASVLNLSLGQEPGDSANPVPVEAIQEAVDYARGKGCLLVAAAGNNNSQPAPVMYPAAAPGVVAVAATTASDAPWSSSNRGPEVDIAAPGVDIISTGRYGSYYFSTGTSMATAHVSGLAMLVWSLEQAFSADQVTHVITTTAHDVHSPGWDSRTGWGRIDAQATVLHLVQPEVDLVVDRPSIPLGQGTATLTATVVYSQGQPAPDGLTVSFSTDLGQVHPESATTFGGQATTHFSSTLQSGDALITASVGEGYSDSVTVEIVSEPFPDITVAPELLGATLGPGEGTTQTLTVGNVGTAELNWSVVELTPAGWLTESLTGGTVAPFGETDVVVAFDATGLPAGVHTTTLRISSDDPDASQLDVPTRLLVAPHHIYLPLHTEGNWGHWDRRPRASGKPTGAHDYRARAE